MGALQPRYVGDTADAVSRLGRTEDLRLSPDNTRMALAGYTANSCLVLEVRISLTGSRPEVEFTSATEMLSDDLVEPHGFDFVDNQTLVVGNRGGCVTVFDLPALTGGSIRVPARHRITRASWTRRLHSPGSVLVRDRNENGFDLLVCNNYRNRITSHRVDRSGRIRNRVALSRGMKVPDGITQSPDARWLAISSHFASCVLIYDTEARLTRRSEPHGRLNGVGFPHGVRFSPDGHLAFVADAGAPLVHIFHSRDGDWSGNHAPIASHRVLTEAVFQRGHVNVAEGGPKGVDIDASGSILLISCEEQPLAFFAVADLI